MYNLNKDLGRDTGSSATKDLYPMSSAGVKSPDRKPAPVANSALLNMATRQGTFNF